jgi:DNA primase
MMPKYNLQKIKKLNGIVDVAREFGYDIEDDAMVCFRAQSHENTNNPRSLKFDPERNSFKCSDCESIGGDVIDFVVQGRGLRFYDAVRYLADRVNLEPENGNDSGINFEKKHNENTDEFNGVYEVFYNACTKLNSHSEGWLRNRDISKETAEKQGLRSIHNLNGLHELLTSKYPLEFLRDSGLFNKRDELIFRRHKIIVPYYYESKIVYLHGLTTNPHNRLREICLARSVPCPYNYQAINNSQKTVVICKSILDTLTLIENDIRTIGIPGTNGFKDEWVHLFDGCEVKVAFGSDIESQARAVELVHKFRSNNISAQKIYLPDNYGVNQVFHLIKQFSG